jgi:hypothetical protein
LGGKADPAALVGFVREKKAEVFATLPKGYKSRRRSGVGRLPGLDPYNPSKIPEAGTSSGISCRGTG